MSAAWLAASLFAGALVHRAPVELAMAVTPIGAPCFDQTPCGNEGLCQPPFTAATGTPIWTGGYCTQPCGSGSPKCPSGSFCTQVATPKGIEPMCLKSCRVGHPDDCRPGYACASTSNGGVCASACWKNGDCGQNYVCRVCDGLCVGATTSAQVGDICQSDTSCGVGQNCVRLDENGSLWQCAAPCGNACGQCPPNSTCRAIPAARDQFYCVRDCTTGTCPNGLQCANFATGRGCLPPCTFDVDCPTGTKCNAGECNAPNDGGVCGVLCQKEDSGVPVDPPKKDAGVGGQPGSGGCGCNAPSLGPGVLIASLSALKRRRKKQGERR